MYIWYTSPLLQSNSPLYRLYSLLFKSLQALQAASANSIYFIKEKRKILFCHPPNFLHMLATMVFTNVLTPPLPVHIWCVWGLLFFVWFFVVVCLFLKDNTILQKFTWTTCYRQNWVLYQRLINLNELFISYIFQSHQIWNAIVCFH